MIVIPVSNKTLLVRHWLRWYLVQRGATDWKKLKVAPRPTPFSITKTIGMLEKAEQSRGAKTKTVKKKSSKPRKQSATI